MAPDLVDYIAAYVGWEIAPDFNAFAASPFMVGLAVAAVPLILRMTGFYHRCNQQRIVSALKQLFTFVVYYLGVFGLYVISRGDTGSTYMNHVILVSLLLIVVLRALNRLMVRFPVLVLSRMHPLSTRLVPLLRTLPTAPQLWT